MQWQCLGVVCSLSVGVALASRSWGAEEDELLEQVRQGNRSAIQSIHTFSCRVAIGGGGNGSPDVSVSGEYWRSLDAVRVKSSTTDIAYDSLQRDSEVRTVATHKTRQSNQPQVIGGIVPDRGISLPDCDVWMRALMVFPTAEGEFTLLTIDELLKKPHRLGRVVREVHQGQEYIVVEFLHPSRQPPARREIWFDPQVNFLARKYVVTQTMPGSPPKVFRTECDVVRFQEVAPAIFFPERVEVRGYKGDDLLSTAATTFSEVRINQPLPSGIFDFRFPPGILIRDAIQGKSYEVDADGDPTGAVLDLPKPLPPPVGLPPPGETLEDPKSWTRWLLPGSLGLLTLAAILWGNRRWQRSRRLAPHIRS